MTSHVRRIAQHARRELASRQLINLEDLKDSGLQNLDGTAPTYMIRSMGRDALLPNVDALSLIPIGRDGTPIGYGGELSEWACEVVDATVGHYQKAGFVQPWIGYFAVLRSAIVGTCAFTSPPSDGRVEIAYWTNPNFEGLGVATSMARKLVAVAVSRARDLVVVAQTLPERNASHRVLEKIGFRYVSTVDHPEDGEVWEWHLVPSDIARS